MDGEVVGMKIGGGGERWTARQGRVTPRQASRQAREASERRRVLRELERMLRARPFRVGEP